MRPPITLSLPSQGKGELQGLEGGDETNPPEDEGGFNLLTEDDEFPFTYDRLSHANAPKLTPNENTGALHYSLPIVTPPGRNGKEPGLELTALHEEVVAFQVETRQNFRDVRDDIAGLRKETEFEFEDLLGRVKYVEQKLGIESGK